MATIQGSGTQADPWTRWVGYASDFYNAVSNGGTYYTKIGAYFNILDVNPSETNIDYFFLYANPNGAYGFDPIGEVGGSSRYDLHGTCTSTGTVDLTVTGQEDGDDDPSQNKLIHLIILTNIIASGTCGDNLTWELIDNGELVISGSGAMYDYTSSNHAPWYDYRSTITSLSLPAGLTSIGAYAFHSCASIAGTLVIPDSVTSIGNYAFYGCSGFTGALTLPSGITAINYASFESCRGFTSLVLPDGLLSIGAYSFMNCENLAGTLTLPSSISSIGVYAFRSCHNLTGALTIPTSVTTLGNNAFDGCWGLTTLKIMSRPNIGSYAFRQCINVTEIEFYANQAPQSIGIDAFRLGDSSHSVTATVRSVGNWAASTLSGDYTTFIFISWYAVVLAANGNGTVSGGGMYDEDTSVTIIATPAAHNHFVNWSDENTSPSRTFTVTENVDLIANFKVDVYTITWKNWDGTILETDTDEQYGSVPSYNGATPTRTPTTQIEYLFTGWDPTPVLVSQDAEYVAQFTPVARSYTVSLSASGAGNVYGAGTYEYGTTVTISAAGVGANHFVKWSDGDAHPSRTFQITEDINLTAYFEKIHGTLVLSYRQDGCTYTLECGAVTVLNEDIKANILQTPIPVYSADNAFTFDIGSVENIQINIVRRNPEVIVDPVGIPDNVPDIYDIDWSQYDTTRWSNRIWKMALISMIDRWQMKTDGLTVNYIPYVLDEGGDGVYQAEIKENGYLKSLDISYDITSFEVLRVTLHIAIGSINMKGGV